MSDLGCLHRFVNIHAEIFVQSFYAVIESSQIECLECPVEKTSNDNFLLKIYFNNIINSIRTFFLINCFGTVGCILHNNKIEEKKKVIFLGKKDTCKNILENENSNMSEYIKEQTKPYENDNINDNEKDSSSPYSYDINQQEHRNAYVKKNDTQFYNYPQDKDVHNKLYNDEYMFLKKCERVHSLRKELENATLKYSTIPRFNEELLGSLHKRKT
ncbi:hypothetical protein PRSY57_1469000 [Plasmodium reichenowi]|uniref:Uncharacterized protein n=1 Tax=Plasmodium reichenowi TaxID=5854 RepID=A0A151L5V6_PLARE|nr:hypothetical protein PRSY57_1469000 [Plasmodium reichenowi]KYN94348.1 hypothetical protein PRSY57_1469000 [Plasmodium reichenowi]